MNKTYLFCRVAVAPVRSEAKDDAELDSQFLFGELAELLEVTGHNWLNVKSLEDGYEGFVDPKQFLQIAAIEQENWKIGRKRQFTAIELQTPRGIANLPTGCYVKEHFSIQHHLYTIQRQTSPYSSWKEYALSFLNVPYLWGGRSQFGIDCSGFSQQIARFNNVNLPRNASQQAVEGINVEYSSARAGDFAFFHNEKGKVTHVGILLEKQQIIHASGFVKIDHLTDKGIVCVESKELTHHLHSIKRYW